MIRNVTGGHLREIFGYYGNVKNVDLKYDRKNRQSKGQATISFQTEKDAEHAMFYLDGGQIDGSEIKVSFVLVEQDHARGSSSPGNDLILYYVDLVFSLFIVFSGTEERSPRK